MNNAQRAERVVQALKATYEEGHLIEQSLGDLLCDIRHLCDREGLNFELLQARGESLYWEERREEQIA